jgi:hypothetical protein
MKAMLFPLRLNELLGGAVEETANPFLHPVRQGLGHVDQAPFTKR